MSSSVLKWFSSIKLFHRKNHKTHQAHLPKKYGHTNAQYAFWLLPLSLIFASYLLIFKDLPSPASLGKYDIPLATKIYDRNGKLLFDIFVSQNRTAVPLSDMPLYVRQATISIEDKNFYQHQGINPIGGMLRGLLASITGKGLQGGSTITQQLVKSALLNPERTITRKIRELILATWVELLYPKDKILELYLNQVPYGGTAWGVESAAERYFGKSVKELDLAQATLLAGLPQAPTLYSPFGAHPEYAKTRQKEVLDRMVGDRYITKAQADQAAVEPLVYKNETGLKAGHFVMYVKQQLVDTYNLASIVTNQVQAKPDVFFGNPIQAAGGNILAHGSTYRIYLRKGKGDTRVAKMVDAPGLPESEAVFKITENGIEDAE